MTGTDVQARPEAAVASPVDAMAATLTAARVPAIKALLAHKLDSDAVSVVLGATTLLGRVMTQAENGVAVGVHVLRSNGVTGKDIAANIGRSEGRVSQLANLGSVIAQCGLPEGWKSGISYADLEKSVTGKGSKEIREIAALKVSAQDKRAKISAKVAEIISESEQAKLDAKAVADTRKARIAAEKEGKLGPAKTDTQSVPAPAPEVPAYGDKIEDALSSLRMAAAWLTGRVGDMTDAQREHCRSSLAPLADALYTARQNVAEQAPVATPRKRPARKSA